MTYSFRSLTNCAPRYGLEVCLPNSPRLCYPASAHANNILYRSPYKFEAPWHAFEFAFHVLSVEANLVIITMAWVTREDGRHFSRMPEEPDMETLTYWYVLTALWQWLS